MDYIIGNRKCHIFGFGAGAPAVLLGIDAGEKDAAERIAARLGGILSDRLKPEMHSDPADVSTPADQTGVSEGFLLAAYESEDWNTDFSPWPAPAVFKNKGQSKSPEKAGADANGCDAANHAAADPGFRGCAAGTLSWITDSFIPFLRQNFGAEAFIPAGYSLAGLFSLYAFYAADTFSGAVSCSGSLWFPGWAAYAEEHSAKSRGPVYLSLGLKEEKTKNAVMARVGDCTRRQAELLRADSAVAASILEWNVGGHFADPEERLAKGIGWILKNRFPVR